MSGTAPTEEYTDDFIAHAARCSSQYDLTCRTLAADLERSRARVARLTAALDACNDQAQALRVLCVARPQHPPEMRLAAMAILDAVERGKG